MGLDQKDKIKLALKEACEVRVELARVKKELNENKDDLKTLKATFRFLGWVCIVISVFVYFLDNIRAILVGTRLLSTSYAEGLGLWQGTIVVIMLLAGVFLGAMGRERWRQ